MNQQGTKKIGGFLIVLFTMVAFFVGADSQTEVKKNVTTEQQKSKDLIVTRTFDAPLDEVWRYWVEPERVKKWWGPDGFTSPFAHMDFREGGTSLVCMRAPKEFGGQDLYNTWTYRKIVPRKSIEFVADWADKDGNRIDPVTIGLPADMPRDMREVITFKTLSGGKTEMTVTEYGYTSEQMLNLSRLGLEQCLKKMAKALAEQ